MGESSVVIFDIDGTLVDLAGAGSRALGLALEDRCGLPGALTGVSFAGRTDRAILTGALSAAGLEPTEALLESVYASYLELLPGEVAQTPYSPTPGACELVETLVLEPGTSIGIATGNVEGAAHIKLESAGFDLSCFEFGAFGQEHSERVELIRGAISRGAVNDSDPAVYVVGDTPIDVRAAHEAGVTAVGVAQGPFSAQELEASGAELVVESLAEALERRFWLPAAV